MRSTFTPRPVLIAALCSALLACPLARAESGFVLNIAHMNDTHSKFDPVDGVLRNPALSGGGIRSATISLGVLQALVLAGAGFDDDDPPEFVRERSIVKIGGVSEGDYRDWDEIRSWAGSVAASLL